MTLTSAAVRRLVLEVAGANRVGHVGSCLSVVELVTVLHRDVLDRHDPDDVDRDRFVLSKGHAALTLHAALHLLGHLDRATLDTYCRGDGPLGVHADHRVPGVDISTGSLGMGLSIGVGMALAARLQGSRRRTVVLASDAELNAGMTWEAIHGAAHHRLDRLALVVDLNGQQALGRTRDVLDLDPLPPRFAGWTVREVDGHDEAAIADALSRPADGRPLAVLARTVAGRGVSFMEGRVEWHYLPMDDDQFAEAMAQQS